MGGDDDLTSLHGDAKFDSAVKRARENELKAPYEKGAEIDGIKAIEAFPEGGFRYRIRIGIGVRNLREVVIVVGVVEQKISGVTSRSVE